MDGPKQVKAVFVRREYPLEIEIEGMGIVDDELVEESEGREFEPGSRVRLTALPIVGWRFDHGEGELEGEENPPVIIVDDVSVVRAVFVQEAGDGPGDGGDPGDGEDAGDGGQPGA